MQIKAILNKPYTNNQKLDFIVKYNHNFGYEIKETNSSLEAWGYTDEEIKQAEKERVAKLSLTAADVERAIYKAKGIDFEDIVGLVQKYNQQLETLKSDYAQKLAQYNELTPEMQAEQEKPIEPEGSFIDVKALKIELKANNFYRGNSYVERIGVLLGYSSMDLDYLFMNKELPILKGEDDV